MSSVRLLRVHLDSIRFLLRLLAIILVWSIVVGLGTAFFFAPRGTEAQPSYFDLIGFGCAIAIAGAAAAIVAVGLAGKRRWAVEIALAVALTAAAAVALAYLALWFAPWTVRSRMDAWSFLRLREDVLHWGEAIALFHAPMEVGVGSVAGVIAGLLILLGRRWPRLATGIALGLLFACAVDSVRQFVFDVVIRWGWIIRALHNTWAMTDEQIWATAAVFGAIAGAVIAGFAVRMAGRHRSNLVPAQPAEGSRQPAGPSARRADIQGVCD
ncbi:MAG TPA: hypothetical protein VFF52_24325 [Isosphaeraceae bacterium]|nr:hypothetical protein [Isosphaeraceae bacterium]